MEQLKQKEEISENLSETSTQDQTSCYSAEQQAELKEQEVTLSMTELEQKRLKAKVSLMHKRWEGEIEGIYSEKD